MFPAFRPGWKWFLLLTLFYAVAVVAATYPRVAKIESHLPSLVDPLHHIWIMHWWKACLTEGQSPILSTEIQAPIGAPLGNFSPLFVQTALQLPVVLISGNEVLGYNIAWFLGLIGTGLGTYVLIWQILRDRTSATLGGLLAMLSGPLLLHARDHLDIIFAGSMPLFLTTWIRLFEQPRRSRLLSAVGAYGLVAACHPYHLVFVTVPAALYFGWHWFGSWRSHNQKSIITGVHWLLRFLLLSVPLVVLIYSNHIWAFVAGYTGERGLGGYAEYSAPIWSYFMPTASHRLSRYLMPFDPYHAAGIYEWTIHECGSYLGIVTLFLLNYAALRRTSLPQGRFWWSTLVLMAILAFGAYWTIESTEIGLPALWLKKYCAVFKPIRVPSRFNLLVAVLASVIAAAGFLQIKKRVGQTWGKVVFVGATLVTIFDLSIVPFPTVEVPPLPSCYAFIKERDPDASILEVPQYPSGGALLTTKCSYWQTKHRLTTSAGYSGQSNIVYDRQVMINSPFLFTTIGSEFYLDDPDDFLNPKLLNVQGNQATDIVHAAGPFTYGFDDYLFLYMKVFGYDYLVVHKTDAAIADKPGLAQLRARLKNATIFEDEECIVIDHARMPRPVKVTIMPLDGWRTSMEWSPIRVAERQARVAIFNPEASQDLIFVLEAKSLQIRRTVRLFGPGQREIGRWEVPAAHELPVGGFESLYSPAFRLREGIQILTLVSDHESLPQSSQQRATAEDGQPYSLRVAATVAGVWPEPEIAAHTETSQQVLR